ncbi:uncharacterized protein G2W53_012606 [Senna tora]|uniref:Uncharacterized protein n=1 Tax=Senna tora TaxID=362788 RepID=A0A834TXC1_9FABA|nr:uncharacterized protein G2W53_012606 [Senna tora]
MESQPAHKGAQCHSSCHMIQILHWAACHAVRIHVTDLYPLSD